LFLTTTGSSPLTDVTGSIPSLFIARIVIDPSNSAVAYVTLDGYTFQANHAVWKTTNLTSGHPTWQAAGNGIPDIPVNAFVVDPDNPQHLFAGTDIGTYYSPNGGAQWLPFSNGLPRVPVFDLGFQGTQHALRAATHGRGIWEITPPSASDVARIDVLQGDGQRAAVGSMLPVLLSAKVLDSVNNPVASVTVQFNAPTTGPSGTFSGGVTSASAVTDALGVATAPRVTANSVVGSYSVTASVTGVASPAVFSLTNLSNAIFSDGFEIGSLTAWSSATP
jgi:hypothetical protein